MAADRFISDFRGGAPSIEELGELLYEYLGALGEVSLQNGVWFVSLPGRPSGCTDDPCELRTRWFEVCCSDECVDVLTRAQDELVSAIAEGFAELVSRHFRGRRES